MAKPKVLLIGVYRDSTGYGMGCIEYLKALNEVCDVVCRPIKLNNSQTPLEDIVAELENKSSKDCDVVIEYILPSFFEVNLDIKQNIGLFACETDYFGNSNWPEKLNLMDKVFLINEKMRVACNQSGVTTKQYVVNHPINLSKCHKVYQPYNLPCLKSDFVFYTISEFSRRKNFAALVKAFHLEFDTDEPVELVIKTHLPGVSPDESRAKIVEYCNEIKKGLKLYTDIRYYKPEILITERFTEEQLMELHARGDVFVSPSFGEAFQIGCAEAMAAGKTPIVTAKAGMEYVTNDVGYVVESHQENVFGQVESPFELYKGNEIWRSISIEGLRKAMRVSYENRQMRQEKADNGIEKSFEYSYGRIGQKLLECIND